MQSKVSKHVGLLYLIIGLALFVLVAGEFLLKLSIAALALWLALYGLQLWQGKPVSVLFWQIKSKMHR